MEGSNIFKNHLRIINASNVSYNFFNIVDNI